MDRAAHGGATTGEIKASGEWCASGYIDSLIIAEL